VKNQAKLKEWGLEGTERYYYLRFGQKTYGKPVGGIATVCIIPLSNEEKTSVIYARGVSFCNPKDQLIKKKGRAKALGRAAKAIESHQFTEPIPKGLPCSILTRNNMGWTYFSGWDITLTEYEQRLFAKEAR